MSIEYKEREVDGKTVFVINSNDAVTVFIRLLRGRLACSISYEGDNLLIHPVLDTEGNQINIQEIKNSFQN